ncbi:hypothetical protein D3C73_1027570 [compost metagenome]
MFPLVFLIETLSVPAGNGTRVVPLSKENSVYPPDAPSAPACHDPMILEAAEIASETASWMDTDSTVVASETASGTDADAAEVVEPMSGAEAETPAGAEP